MPWVIRGFAQSITEKFTAQIQMPISRLPLVKQILLRQYSNIGQSMVVWAQHNRVAQIIRSTILPGNDVVPITTGLFPTANGALIGQVTLTKLIHNREAAFVPFPIAVLATPYLAPMVSTCAFPTAVAPRVAHRLVVPKFLSADNAKRIGSATFAPIRAIRTTAVGIAAFITAIDALRQFAGALTPQYLLAAITTKHFRDHGKNTTHCHSSLIQVAHSIAQYTEGYQNAVAY